MFLLDTNPCIAYLNRRSSRLRDRIDSLGDQEIAVCSVVRAELLFGAAKSRFPEKTAMAQEEFLGRFPSFSFDDSAARVYGPIRAELERKGNSIGAHDLLIASIAVAHNLTLVTHNTAEFARIPGLEVQDWEADEAA
jgi:tRNA(fMet)-specific endonuclease VapC